LAALSALFVQVLKLCERAGLVKLGHVALDGTKIKTNASKPKAMSYERMCKREAELQAEVDGWRRKGIGGGHRNGIGSQELERIFNPLFTTKSGGMGMGLSICRSIIEAHDGRLWVAPNNPEGAVFQFMLRADGATSVGASRREQPEEPPA